MACPTEILVGKTGEGLGRPLNLRATKVSTFPSCTSAEVENFLFFLKSVRPFSYSTKRDSLPSLALFSPSATFILSSPLQGQGRGERPKNGEGTGVKHLTFKETKTAIAKKLRKRYRKNTCSAQKNSFFSRQLFTIQAVGKIWIEDTPCLPPFLCLLQFCYAVEPLFRTRPSIKERWKFFVGPPFYLSCFRLFHSSVMQHFYSWPAGREASKKKLCAVLQVPLVASSLPLSKESL